MSENRTYQIYFTLFSIFFFMLTILMGFLFYEYHFFRNQAQELIALKQQYYFFIDEIQMKLSSENEIELNQKDQLVKSFQVAENENTSDDTTHADDENSDDPADEENCVGLDDSFVVINRHPEYLKQSTLDYLQSQELDSLMTSIDMDQWTDYTEQKITPIVTRKKITSTLHSNNKKILKKSTPIQPRKDFDFILPITKGKFWISSLYGPRKRINGTWGFHHGVDLAAIRGTHVKAVRDGIIVEARYQKGYGNTIVIKHNGIVKTRYAHLHSIRVHVGQKVQKGSIIGTVGETGFIRKKGKDGSHLHFEVYEHGKRVNPLHCLPRS